MTFSSGEEQMDKTRNAERFARAYVKLNEGEKATFSRIANKLLSSSFLCERKENDRSDYYDCQNHLSLYQDYFMILDYEVAHYENDRVIQLRSLEHYNHLNLKLNESVLLLLLRKLYARHAREISLNENITVTVEEVHDAVMETGFLNKRLNKTDFREIIRLFKRFSLLDNIGDIDRDESMLVLYPTLNHAVPYEDLSELSMRIRKYGREEESSKTTDEDTSD